MSITYLSPGGVWGEDKHYSYNTKVVKFLFLAKKEGEKWWWENPRLERSEFKEFSEFGDDVFTKLPKFSKSPASLITLALSGIFFASFLDCHAINLNEFSYICMTTD